jgi:hypothetical protein
MDMLLKIKKVNKFSTAMLRKQMKVKLKLKLMKKPQQKKCALLINARNIEDSRLKQRVVKNAKIGQLKLLMLMVINQLKSLHLMI